MRMRNVVTVGVLLHSLKEVVLRDLQKPSSRGFENLLSSLACHLRFARSDAHDVNNACIPCFLPVYLSRLQSTELCVGKQELPDSWRL